MMSQPGLVAPDSYPIRDPKDPAQKNGRIHNPPRFQTLGGLSGPGKWPEGSDFPVQRPAAAAKGAKRAYEKKI